MLKEKSGIALFVVLMLMVVLLVLGGALLSRSISENRLAEWHARSMQAFWAAEAGVDVSLASIRDGNLSSGYGSNEWGVYNYEITVSSPDEWVIISTGRVEEAQRVIRAEAEETAAMPPDLALTNVIYAAGSYETAGGGGGAGSSITGGIVYAETITGNTNNITGEIVCEPSIAPLFDLDFETLREKAEEMGYLYLPEDFTSKGKLTQEAEMSKPYPPDFYNLTVDPGSNTPNVVYIENDEFALSGNDIIGGLIVVAGTDVEGALVGTTLGEEGATVGGTPEINGCFYVRGPLTVHGTGGIDGAIWVSDFTDKGHGTDSLTYNAGYAGVVSNYLETVSTGGVIRLSGWREISTLE